MWVEVTRWSDGKIEGLLANDPFEIPSLRAGQNVTVNEADIFDYIHRHADGKQEGNTTGAIIEQMSGQ
jgi:uncharacterized protein YegJ (DUF2314 family)